MIEPSRSLEVDANEDVAAVGVEGGYEKASDKVGNYCKFAVISDFITGFFITTFYAYGRDIFVRVYLQRT